MEWDLSPRRPWEDALIDAAEWELATDVQAAYREGKQTAQSGHQADQAMAKRRAELMEGRSQC